MLVIIKNPPPPVNSSDAKAILPLFTSANALVFDTLDDCTVAMSIYLPGFKVTEHKLIFLKALVIFPSPVTLVRSLILPKLWIIL